MPWIKKIKPKHEHICDPPDLRSYHPEGEDVVAGSIWKCFWCRRSWQVMGERGHEYWVVEESYWSKP